MENSFKLSFSFSQNDVEIFAQITGDNNPIHLDNEYASTTIFKKRIMHGFLGASIFSRILGTLFPGNGTIYLKQELKFIAPMYVDQEYTALVEVLELIKDKGRARLQTRIIDGSGNETISGEALVQNPIFI